MQAILQSLDFNDFDCNWLSSLMGKSQFHLLVVPACCPQSTLRGEKLVLSDARSLHMLCIRRR